MPTVIFERPKGDKRPPITIPVPEGGALVDTCDDHAAPIPFSCKSASCGTCRVVVLEGESSLEPAADEELSVLDCFASSPPRFRLACQARLNASATVLRVRPVTDDE